MRNIKRLYEPMSIDRSVGHLPKRKNIRLTHVLAYGRITFYVTQLDEYDVITQTTFRHFIQTYPLICVITTSYQFLVADTRLYTQPCRSVGRSVRPSVRNIFESRVVFAFPLLPNCPRLSCRVSGLVFHTTQFKFLMLALSFFPFPSVLIYLISVCVCA